MWASHRGASDAEPIVVETHLVPEELPPTAHRPGPSCRPSTVAEPPPSGSLVGLGARAVEQFRGDNPSTWR